MSRTTYTHRFVKAFPDKLDEGILYVSVEFGTAAHGCFCGCGCEVYTRFSPRDWSMKFNGEAVSISPSIGNWSFPCQSHYILDCGRVRWADKWSRERIEFGRRLDRDRKDLHYKGEPQALPPVQAIEPVSSPGRFTRLVRWLIGK